MADTIDALVRLRAADDATTPMVIDPTARTTYAALDVVTRRLAATFVDHGIGKGSRVGLIMPNGVDWVRIAVALTRIGAVLVPLSTLLAPRELVAQLRVASVQYLVAVDEFRGHRYHDDLRTELETSHIGDRTLHHPMLPALRRVWTPDTMIGTVAGPGATAVCDAMTAAVTPNDPLVVMFTQEAAAYPRAWCTPMATPWLRCDPASVRDASAPTPGCTCRCRSSGSVASAAACCPHCSPGPHW